jgi:ribonuclease HII
VRSALGWHDRRLLRNASRIIGIDEVGRGALVGPVVVGAVAFERIPVNPEIQDSKSLSRARRERAARWVRDHCMQWVVVEVDREAIDRLNILEATRGAMRAAALCLAGDGAVVVTDAVELGLSGLRVLAPKQADARFFTVAAASILAKVHRDAVIVQLAAHYPAWGWARNVGYPSPAHRQALADQGMTFLHRRSFACSRTTTKRPTGR